MVSLLSADKRWPIKSIRCWTNSLLLRTWLATVFKLLSEWAVSPIGCQHSITLVVIECFWLAEWATLNYYYKRALVTASLFCSSLLFNGFFSYCCCCCCCYCFCCQFCNIVNLVFFLKKTSSKSIKYRLPLERGRESSYHYHH